jgi:hypothetical protein
MSFSESALFAGLRAKKIKKSFPISSRVSGCAQPASKAPFLLAKPLIACLDF